MTSLSHIMFVVHPLWRTVLKSNNRVIIDCSAVYFNNFIKKLLKYKLRKLKLKFNIAQAHRQREKEKLPNAKFYYLQFFCICTTKTFPAVTFSTLTKWIAFIYHLIQKYFKMIYIWKEKCKQECHNTRVEFW